MWRPSRFAVLAAIAVTVACREPNAPTTPLPTRPTPLASSGLEAPTADFIVVLQEAQTDVPGTANRLAALFGTTPKVVWQDAIKGFVVALVTEDAYAMRQRPEVMLVEKDQPVTADATQAPTPSWGIDRIDQRALPLNNSYTYKRTGLEVNAYIIDTGIRGTHTEFVGRMRPGATFIFDGFGTNDCNGHGTHVAGTIGGTRYGVAKQVALHPVRVLNCLGRGTWAGIISGINWVRANARKPAVANMSLGGGFSVAVNMATNNLIGSGVPTVVAAGNSNLNACFFSPASTASAITVGATTATDARAGFSNWGGCLDLFAPGANITSAWATSNVATNTISGTSMAAPHVAGVVAQFLAANGAMTPAQVAAAIVGNATAGVVGNPGIGSPNRLLFSAFIP